MIFILLRPISSNKSQHTDMNPVQGWELIIQGMYLLTTLTP